MLASLQSIPAFFLRPVRILRAYNRSNLIPDTIAGITVGVVLLPQAIAFSLLAGLPPTMGLYTAILAGIVGAIWGSSNHLQTGPTNTASILMFSVLLPIAVPGSPQFVAAAGVIAVFAGCLRLLMGLARLGILVNFVSDSVVVGFTAGAGILIGVAQLSALLRVDAAAAPDLPGIVRALMPQLPETHIPSLLLGVGTILLIVVLRQLFSRLPTSLIGISTIAIIAWGWGLEQQGVQVLGEIPSTLPPYAHLSLFDFSLIGQLSTGALAMATIGLVEASAIARAISSNSGQRLDSNQEFVGQGLANIVSGLFSGYPSSGSFNRSTLNYRAGAQTAMSAAFAGLFVLVAMLTLAPIVAHLPRAVIAAELILAAYGMVDRKRIMRIWRGARGDAAIMSVTLLATLFLPLQFAVLIGVLMSLGYYILQTSAPQVLPVLPDDDFRHWVHQPNKPSCPQLGVLDVLGDLYFGAVNHIEESIYQNMARNPNQRFLLLRMHSVQRCDISGINALEGIVRTYRARGGDVYMVRVREPVLQLMQKTGFYNHLGPDHFLEEDQAIGYLFHKVIDPAVCIYESEVRAFRECQILPKRDFPLDIPLRSGTAISVNEIPARTLWERLRAPEPPLVIDVREPREFRLGRVPQAELLPLATLLTSPPELPREHEIVLVCRSGRRSARAAAVLAEQGYTQVSILRGGMLDWEAAGLLEALD